MRKSRNGLVYGFASIGLTLSALLVGGLLVDALSFDRTSGASAALYGAPTEHASKETPREEEKPVEVATEPRQEETTVTKPEKTTEEDTAKPKPKPTPEPEPKPKSKPIPVPVPARRADEWWMARSFRRPGMVASGPTAAFKNFDRGAIM